MQKIKQLPDEIVSQIAAGEVITRPSYAVKELIENSIDAKATNIRVLIEDSGMKRISVQDNGFGMSNSDIQVSFLPHSTSKLNEEFDLQNIHSLGFRGEALSSIASIGNLNIQSRQIKQKSGYSLTVEYSRLIDQKPVGMPEGTIVTITNLFGNVPVRKKFLKTQKTEFRHILEEVINHALSNPDISFDFFHNKKQIFSFPEKQPISERICGIIGEDAASQLLPISYEDSYIKLNGFISKPQLSGSSVNKIHTFVNSRPITDSLIVESLKDGYANLLEAHRYPVSFLWISLPPYLIDVNIHPRKEYINFIDKTFVFSSISKAVGQTLSSHNLTFSGMNYRSFETSSYAGQKLKTELQGMDIAHLGKVSAKSDVIQLHNLYLVAQSSNGIALFDQHAAHEAILYRKLLNMYVSKSSKKLIHTLKNPLLVTFSHDTAHLLKEHINTLAKLGFQIEEFGIRSFKVYTVPDLLHDRNIQEIIEEILTDIESEKTIKTIDNKTNQMLASLACRQAIKSGDKLTKSDIKIIIKELEYEDYIYTCPHGRPVKIDISINELEKLFKRK